MDYGKILSRAWEITWRWKVLWILGFLAALGQGGGGGGGGSSYSGDGSEWGGQVPPDFWPILAAVVCLALIIGIVIWVVSIIARGGLIAGVQQVEDEGSTSFGQAWRVGAGRFWTLFGIGILAALPFILLLIGGIIAFIAMVGGGVALSDVSGGGAVAVILPMLCFGGVFCCGMIILGIVLEQIRVYAERAAILEGLGWIEAFKRGWDVLKENFGPTIVFWLIFLVIGLALAAIVFGIMMVTMIPFIAIVANTDPGPWLLAPLFCGGILAVIVGALIGSIVETFSSATWTLAYREMTGLVQPVVESMEVSAE